MAKVPLYVSGDGYSRMFEAKPDEDETPKELERREMREVMLDLLRHPARGHELNDLLLLQANYGVEFTADNLRRILAAWDKRAADATARLAAGADLPDTTIAEGSLVYYMAMGTLIKIGYSTNLTARLDSIGPESLLAVEPGGVDVESVRHSQFAAWRSHREWFRACPPLQEHVERLAVEHVELLRPWRQWTPVRRMTGAPYFQT